MNQTAVAIIIAGVLVAGSIWLSAPRYAITNERDRVIRIDTASGQISACRSMNWDEEPVCSPWGDRSVEQYKAERQSNAVEQRPRQYTPEEVQKMFDNLENGNETDQP